MAAAPEARAVPASAALITGAAPRLDPAASLAQGDWRAAKYSIAPAAQRKRWQLSQRDIGAFIERLAPAVPI
jgi:hypothetical protein